MQRVLVTGAGVQGGLGDLHQTWQGLCRGQSAVRACRPDGADYPEILGAPAAAFDLSAYLSDRKMAKYMNPVTALTVAAAGMALESAGLVDAPCRREMALFVTTGLIAFDLSRVAPAMAACISAEKELDLHRMGSEGLALCNPLMPFKMHRLLVFAAPALAVLALMPWCLPLRSLHQVSKVFATPVLYSYSPGLQLIDFRACSLLALVFFLFAMARLLRGASDFRSAQFPFFAGVGLLSFSLFRFFLLETYRQSPAWMDFWEETTELIMILGLGWFLLHYRIEAGLRFFSRPSRTRVAPDESRVER